MMTDNLIDIKTGRPVQTKNTREKRGQDAKRWKYLLGMIQRGEATLIVSGNEMRGQLLKGAVNYIDDCIDEEYLAKKREQVRKRRARKSKNS